MVALAYARAYIYYLFRVYARACGRIVSIPNALFSRRLLKLKNIVAILRDISDNFL